MVTKVKSNDNNINNKKDKDIVIEVDAIGTIDEYLKRADWRVNENANIDYSIGGLILKNSGKITANYWLHKVYPKEVGEAHINADLHIHDLDMLNGYCAGWSLRDLLYEGLNGVPGHIQCTPPKHLFAATGQMANFIGTLCNEWSGAQAFSSVDTYLAPYVRIDKADYKMVKQAIQQLLFNLNVPTRWGGQTPFSNFSFDFVCPKDLKDQNPIVGGKPVDFTYSDLQKEMDMINKAFIEVITEGDGSGQPFTFPIPTYSITKDFPWDSEIADMLFEAAAKYGMPNFLNYVKSDLDPTDIRAMCCRLHLDLRELRKRGGGLFGSADKTGSIGNVTINCARLGYVYKGDKESLLKQLDHLMDLAKISLELKREFVAHHLETGLYPFTKRYLGTFKNHFSTMGVNGMNEMIRNFSNDQEDITTDEGQQLAEEVLEFMRNKMVHIQEETGHLYNLEATPGEGTCYRFAKEDKKRYPNILQAGYLDCPYYTNSSQISVGHTDDPFEELTLQDKLQTMYTGGTALHLFMNERISSSDTAKKLIRTVVENFRSPYITITPTFSVCPKHGYISGKHEYCPYCDQEILAKKQQGIVCKKCNDSA